MDEADRNRLSRGIRVVLRRARQPLSLEEIAHVVKAPTADVYEAISIDLHGFYEMKGAKFRWLR